MNIDQQTLAKQAALVAVTQRVQARAEMFLAGAAIVQEYLKLTQQLLAHINELTKNSLTDGGTIPPGAQPGPTGNSSGPSSSDSPGNQTERHALLG